MNELFLTLLFVVFEELTLLALGCYILKWLIQRTETE
jgi:hypothetical protein